MERELRRGGREILQFLASGSISSNNDEEGLGSLEDTPWSSIA